MPDADVVTAESPATVDPPAAAPETAPDAAPVPTDAPPADVPAEAPAAPGEPADAPAAEDRPAETPEERKSRSQRKAEREATAAAEQAERARKDREFEEFKTRYESLQKQDAERAQREADARARYHQFVGTDEEYARLRATAYEPLPDPDTVPAEQWEAYKQRVLARNEAVATLTQYETARGFVGTLQQDALAYADGEVRARVSRELYEAATALEGVDGAVLVDPARTPNLAALIANVAEQVRAPLLAEAARLNEQVAELRTALDAAKARLGGLEPSPEVGGRPAGGKAFTRHDLANMTIDEYRANKAEIHRQSALGLIQ